MTSVLNYLFWFCLALFVFWAAWISFQCQSGRCWTRNSVIALTLLTILMGLSVVGLKITGQTLSANADQTEIQFIIDQ